MTFDSDLILFDIKIKENEVGVQKEEKTNPIKLMAHVKSITRSEFYQSSTAGFSPSCVVVVNDFEYSGQKYAKLDDDDEIYKVLRTYKTKGLYIELVLQKKENGGRYENR